MKNLMIYTFLVLAVPMLNGCITARVGEPSVPPVVEYLLDGNAQDSGGREQHGEMSGATPCENRFSEPGKACYFDGNDFITIPDAPELRGMSALTVSCWFKADSLPNMHDGGAHPVSKANNGDGQMSSDCFALGLSRTDDGKTRITATVWNGSSHSSKNEAIATVVTKKVSLGKWHHLMMSYDGTTVRLFVDGREEALQQFGKRPLNDNKDVPLRIGRIFGRSVHNKYFHGAIDDVRIYNCAVEK